MKTAEDFSHLVAAIMPETTSHTPLVCDRLRRACLVLKDGPREYTALRKALALSENQCKSLTGPGYSLGVLVLERRGGNPALISLNPSALQSLQRRPEASPGTAPNATKLQAWKRVSWRKTGLSSEERVRNVALVCLAIGDIRQVGQAELAGELRVAENTVWQAVRDAKYLKLLSVQRKEGRGRKPSVYAVDWKRVETFWGKGSNAELDLSNRWRPFHERRPSEDRLTTEQRQLLVAADTRWRELGFRTYADWLRARTLFTAIGASRLTMARELARDFEASVAVIKTIARSARQAGLLEVSVDYANGRAGARSTYRVNWGKLRTVAGDHQKAASNGSAAKRGGRPSKWDHACDWVEQYRADNPGSTLSAARTAYRTKFPERETPSLPKLKAAIYGRRSKAE